jgi:hypothetical protein
MKYFPVLLVLLISTTVSAQLSDRKQYTQPGGQLIIGELYDVDGDGYEEYFVHSEGSYYVRGVGQSQWADIIRLSGSFDRALLDVADVDTDGDLDIVGYDVSTGDLVVHTQIADHEYSIQRYDLDVPSPAQSLVAADLDGDGQAEIYLGTESWDNLIAIKVQDGTVDQEEIEADRVRAMDSGVDSDGPYLAIAWNGTTVAKLTQTSQGEYVTESIPAQAAIRYLDVADLDQDGYDDLIYATEQRAYTAQGLAASAWRPAVEVARVSGNRNVEVADYDQDGQLDLVFGNFSLFELRVARQLADWQWERVELDFDSRSYLSFAIVEGTDQALVDGVLFDDIYTGGRRMRTVAENSVRIFNTILKDITGNGATDILYHADVQNAFHLLEGQDDYHQRITTLDPTFGNAATVVDDLNGDGIQDVIFVEGGFLQWFEGVGGGTFTTARSLMATEVTFLRSLQDIDGDGDLDIVATGDDDRVCVFYRIGSTYAAPTRIYTRPGGRDVAFTFKYADADGDGDIDILATDFYGGVLLLKQLAPDAWQTDTYVTANLQLNDGVLLSVNDDDFPDMALLTRTGGGPSYIELFSGDGSRGRSAGVIYNSPEEANGLAIRDVNADGLDDIIILHTDDNEITTMMQRSDGTWTSPILLDELVQPARMIQSAEDDLVVILGGHPNNSRLYTYDFSGVFADLDVQVSNQTCGNNGTVLDDSDDFVTFTIKAVYGPAIDGEYRVEIPTYGIVLFAKVGEELEVVLPPGSAGAGDFEVEVSVGGEEQVIVIQNDEPCAAVDLLTDLDALMIIYRDNNGPNWKDGAAFDQDAWRILYSSYISGNVFFDEGRHCNLPGVTCDAGKRVTQLVLRDINMRNTLSDAIGILTELINLSLSTNSLSALSPAIGRCTKLMHINWTLNEMEGELLPEIGNCTDMRTLKFSLNRHSGPIPESWSQMTELQELVVGNAAQFDGRINRLTALPLQVGNWTKIKTLNLSKSAFTEPLPVSIGGCVALEYLRLNECGIPGEIPQSISNLTNLIQLDLRDNNLTGPLPDSLHLIYSEDLDAIYLQGNNLTGCIPPTYDVFCGIRQLFLNQEDGVWNTAAFCSRSEGACGQDLDMDGFVTPEDCDDADGDVNPDAVEVPFNSIDENCDGVLDFPCYDFDRDYQRAISTLDRAVILCDKDAVDISLTLPATQRIYRDCMPESGLYEGWVVFRATSGSLYFSAQSFEVPLSYALYQLDTFPLTTDMELLRCFTSEEQCNENGLVGTDVVVPLDSVSSTECHPIYGGFLGAHEVPDGFYKYYAIRLTSIDQPTEPVELDLCGTAFVELDGSGCMDVLVPIDSDDDGWLLGDDCDDDNPDINPGTEEVGYNDVDENCDGIAENQCGPQGQRINMFDRAQYICDKSTINVTDWNVLTSEGVPFSCSQQLPGYGFNMVFLKVKVKVGGSLYFKITPEAGVKDVNFVVFKMSNNFDLSTREQLRCIYGGPLPGEPLCFTSTGLRPGDADVFEAYGCLEDGVDSFGAPLEAEDDDEFLVVIRSSERRGTDMQIEWCGTALLVNEEPGDECTDLFVSSEEVVTISPLRVYPNPVSDLLHLEVDGDISNYTTSIIDVLGSVLPVSMRGNALDLSIVPAGVYMLRLEDRSGRVWSERVVVY